MASFLASGNSCWGPNPNPERGCSFPIDASPDGSQLVYGSEYSVVLRDVKTPELCQVYTGHRKAVRVAKFDPSGKVVASGDHGGVVHLWSSDGLELKKELPILGGVINDIGFDHTGKRLAVCGDSKSNNARCVLWESGSPQGEISGSAKRVLSIAIRPNNPGTLAAASEDMKVRLYAGPPFKFSHTFEKHKNFVQCVRYSPDGEMLATASSDKNIYILDPVSAEVKTTLPVEHKGSVFSVCWSKDGKHLLSASGDKTIKLWDVGAEKCVTTITVGSQVNDMQVGCVYADRLAVSLSLSGSLNYLDFDSGKVSKEVQAHSSPVQNLATDRFSNSGEVYCGTLAGGVFAYSCEGRASRFEGAQPKANDGLICNKGVLYSVGHDDALRVAKVSEGKYEFESGTSSVGGTPVDLSGNEELAVSVTESSVVLFKNGKQVSSKPLSGYRGTCVALSPDGTECVVGGSDHNGHLFEISGDSLQPTDTKLTGMSETIYCIAYSEKHVAMGDGAKEITLWSREDYKCVIADKWVFHNSTINCLAFSPNGQHVASGSNDNMVIVWNVDKAMKKTKIPGTHARGVLSLAWLDDNTIVTSGGDGCVKRWTPKLPL
mmetsp:Transcript_1573/g.2435  ORF Transcript_1573/g.2435 Transcript_1573/m.2435 type:complete len:603 (+) Transcript_1573:56-1864(+)